MSTETVVFRVEGMHFGSCSMLIDDTLEDLPGVSDSHTEVKAARSTVTLDINRTDAQLVVDAISALGYPMTAPAPAPPRPQRPAAAMDFQRGERAVLQLDSSCC